MIKMRKNIFKKTVMALATAAMVVGSVFAVPAVEAKAAVTKTIYIEFSEEASYESVALNFWKWQGMSGSTHMKTGPFKDWNPGPVACDKITYNLYKVTINVNPDSFVEASNGLSVYLGYTDTSEGDKREVDPANNCIENWPAIRDALLSEDPAMCISVDVTNWIVALSEVPADIPTDAPSEDNSSYEADFQTLADDTVASGATTAITDNSDDANISQTIIIIGVAIVAIIFLVVILSVVSAKKRASEFDDDDED